MFLFRFIRDVVLVLRGRDQLGRKVTSSHLAYEQERADFRSRLAVARKLVAQIHEKDQ